MKILIVLAHPEPQSFNHALTAAAAESARAYGNEVRVSDLYALGFEADEHSRHFREEPILCVLTRRRNRDPMRRETRFPALFGSKSTTCYGQIPLFFSFHCGGLECRPF